MFFNKKENATSSSKKVNTLAPAFRYPKMNHREKNIFTQDSPVFDDDIDNYLPAYNPTDHLKVEPLLQKSNVFTLEEELRTDPADIHNIFLEENTLGEASLDVLDQELAHIHPQTHIVIEEDLPISLLLDDSPSFGRTTPPVLSSLDLENNLEQDLKAQAVYETVLIQDVEETSLHSFLEDDPLPSPHVAKPAPEKLTPAEEPSLQARTLAYEDEDHYYNPLAIGEVLPSYALSETETQPQSPLDTSVLNVFEDLEDPDLDLQESFAMAQKSSDALEVVFGTDAFRTSDEDAVMDNKEDVAVPIEKEASYGDFVLNTSEEAPPFSFLPIEASPSLSEPETLISLDVYDLDSSFEASLHSPVEECFPTSLDEAFSIQTDLPPLEESVSETSFEPIDENTFDFSLFLDANPEVHPVKAMESVLEADEASTPLAFTVFPVEEDLTTDDDDVLAFNVIQEDLNLFTETLDTPALESNFLALEESLETLSEANLELATSGVELPLQDVFLQDALPLDSFSQVEEDPFETLPPELHASEETSPVLSFETFRQLEEGDPDLEATQASPPSHFSIESDVELEDPNTLLDASLFFSLDALEDGTAPEEISIDLEPLSDFETFAPLPAPLATDLPAISGAEELETEPPHHLLHPVEEETDDEFAAYFPEPTASEATLGEYANLALEDLEVLLTQTFPCGESILYFVHVNDLYAVIALKHHKYTLLQSFSSLPEGVERLQTPEGFCLKEGTLQLTWNASSYDEHIFDLRLGDWHALVVENGKDITLLH